MFWPHGAERYVNVLEHRACSQVRRPASPPSGDLGGDFREDVAVKVRHDDYIERLVVRPAWRLRCRRSSAFFNIGIASAELVEDLVKQAVRELHDFVLREAGDFLRPVRSRTEG